MRNGGERLRIGISGSYGGLNLGDEAILQVIVAQLRRSVLAEITVFTRDAAETRRRHAVDAAVQHKKLSRTEAREVVAGLDLFILGGGGLLYDGDADMYLREVQLAHELDVPVMVYAISAGPLVDTYGRARVRDALERAAILTVRDHRSRALLEEIGVTREIVVTADPAVLLEPEALTWDEILRAEALDPDARLIGISVREPGPAAPHLDADAYHQLVANAADFMSDRLDAEIVFSRWSGRATTSSTATASSRACRTRGARRSSSARTPLGRSFPSSQRFEFTVGMRLHFLIFSARAGLPFVALPYAKKVTGFLEDVGLEAPVLEDMRPGRLIAYIDRAWDMREELRARIGEGLLALQARASRTSSRFGCSPRGAPASPRWRPHDPGAENRDPRRRRGARGGVAGALAALRLGRKVVLSEETDWLGGQLTAQAVPPDEHPWIEGTGCTATYRQLRIESASTTGATTRCCPPRGSTIA